MKLRPKKAILPGMQPPRINVSMKSMFFDRKAVTDAIGRAERAVLVRQGALVRMIAKRSIRNKSGYAPPGKPPHSHTGLLKRFIYYVYERLRAQTIIGPEKIVYPGSVPHLLEYGGTAVAKKTRVIDIDGPQKRKKKGSQQFGSKKVAIKAGTRMRYEPRPYMGPALAKALPKLDDKWANSIKR